MSDPQAVDARHSGEANALTIVCGIPLFVRVLRALSRTNVSQAVVYGRDREHCAELSRALADYPVKAKLEVSIEAAGEQRSLESGALLGWALYDRDSVADASVKPLLVVESKADVLTARRILFASIRKPIALEGIVCYYTHRPLSRLVTRPLVNTKISANQATLLSLAAGLAAAFFAARGDSTGFLLAGIGYFVSGILDCVDGDLARIRIEMSRLGEWMDSMTDELNTLALLVGTGIGIYRGGGEAIWLTMCIGGAVIGALALARQYYELHRRGGAVDTAQFPWFFRSGDDMTTTTADSAIGWILIGIGYLIRRDVNITGISILLILALPKVAAGLIAGGLVGVAGLTIVHFTVMALRR